MILAGTGGGTGSHSLHNMQRQMHGLWSPGPVRPGPVRPEPSGRVSRVSRGGCIKESRTKEECGDGFAGTAEVPWNA